VGGKVVYTPDARYDGTDTFSYTISDPGGLTATATVTVVVVPVPNGPPVTNDGTATVSGDDEVSIPLLANDTDPDNDPLTIGSVSDPTHGTTTIDGDEISYVPDPGYVGTDTFTYSACDPDAACATATVTVTPVLPPNAPPVAVARSAWTKRSATTPIPPSSCPTSSTTTDPLDPDTDHGGISYGVEDADHNGRVDPGENDPNIEDDDLTEPPLDLSGLSAQGSGGCTGGESSAWALLGGLAIAFAVTPRSRQVR